LRGIPDPELKIIAVYPVLYLYTVFDRFVVDGMLTCGEFEFKNEFLVITTMHLLALQLLHPIERWFYLMPFCLL
jgi:hypothetical protein